MEEHRQGWWHGAGRLAGQGGLAIAFVTAAWAASEPMKAAAPVDSLGSWLANHWSQSLMTVTAAMVVYYVRKIDRKFTTLFRWKDEVDKVMGVHEEVWNHEGCGPLWVHHRGDGQSSLHFRQADHPGLCERCRALAGKVIS